MQTEYRRFVIIGTAEQQKALETLIEIRGLSREDLILILHTLALRNPSFDTLAK